MDRRSFIAILFGALFASKVTAQPGFRYERRLAEAPLCPYKTSIPGEAWLRPDVLSGYHRDLKERIQNIKPGDVVMAGK